MTVGVSPSYSPRRTLTVCGGAHALHDGFTDLLNVLYPLLQAQFGLNYATIGAFRSARASDVDTRDHILRPVVVANETLHDLFSARTKAKPAGQPVCEEKGEPMSKEIAGEGKEGNKVPAPPDEIAAK